MREAGQTTGGGTAKAFTFPHGATVPVRPDTAFDLQVVDEGTGYIYSDEGYPAPTDGWREIESDDAPGMDGVPLKIIGGDPFFIISFDASVGTGVPLADGIDYTMAAPDSGLEVSVTSGALPGDPEIRLVNLRNGVSKTLGGGFGDLSFLASEIRIGDPLLLVVEPVLVRGDQALTLRFNKSLDGGGITENDLTLVPLGGATTSDFDLEVDGQTLELVPDPAWQNGSRYQLTIDSAVFGDGRLGHGQNLTQSVALPLRMASSATGESVLPHETDVADVALEGDVLLVAVRDNGLKAFDISDPTAPLPLGYTDGLVGAGAVASDGFGHVIVVEGTAGEHVAMRLYSLDELIATVDQVGPKASLALSPPMTAVGPGDLEIEVFAKTVAFTAAEPKENITVTYDNQADPTAWTELSVPASLLEPNHPVRLVDGVSGAILYRASAPESADLMIPNSKNLPLGHPLVLRAHLDTLAWAFASGGVVDAATITINAGFEYGFSLGATSSNTALLDWVMNHGRVDTCRQLNTGDSVYLGRLAVTPRSDQKAVLLSASRFDGLWGFTQDGDTPDTNPDWVQCLRGPGGERLNDVAASSWPIDDGADEAVLVATVGHRELTIHALTAAQGLDTNHVHVENLEWDPFRVAFDRQNRLVLVRDHNRRLAVYSLELHADKSIELVPIADIELPEGSGLGPLVLDPSLGLAIAGNAPVQYLPPTIELIADTNGDGLPEAVDYLQPLGAPMAPVNEGYTPPLLATLRAHILGVPDGTDQITVRVEGLAPGGAPLPDRPKPFLPSSTRVTLQRPLGLPLDDPGRHTFTSTRPILLIADERARTDYWKDLDPVTRTKLTSNDEVQAVYALCRNCERDLDGNGSQDIPEGLAAAHLGDTPAYPARGPEPIEIASAGALRFTVEPTGSDWLGRLAETDQLPTGEVISVVWGPSPPIGRDPGIEARVEMLPLVELSTGSLSLDRTDLVLPAPGLDVGLGRSYTSAGIRFGLFGWGWELMGLDRLRPNPDGTVDLYRILRRPFRFW